MLVGDHIFATDESGLTSIIKATPAGFEEPDQNRLTNEVFATPVIAGGRIYYRGAVVGGDQRQEWLFCLGNSE